MNLVEGCESLIFGTLTMQILKENENFKNKKMKK